MPHIASLLALSALPARKLAATPGLLRHQALVQSKAATTFQFLPQACRPQRPTLSTILPAAATIKATMRTTYAPHRFAAPITLLRPDLLASFWMFPSSCPCQLAHAPSQLATCRPCATSCQPSPLTCLTQSAYLPDLPTQSAYLPHITQSLYRACAPMVRTMCTNGPSHCTLTMPTHF